MYQTFSRLPPAAPKPRPQLDLSALSREDKLAIVQAAALFGHPWLGYGPTPVAGSFHSCQATDRYIRAASQVGKTIACARETWMYAGNCHPFREVPRSAKLGLIAVGSLEGTAYDAVNRALYATRPDHLIDWERTTWNGKNFIGNYIFMKNGTVVRIVSSRGGSTGAAGVTADFIWVDEPPKRDKFSELLARRTQTGGHVWLSFTPYDSEQADLLWLRNYLEGDPDRGLPAESPGWAGFNVELTVENCPWMTQEKVEFIWKQTPLHVAEQRLKGAWETPPIDGYFVLDVDAHDWNVNPFDTDPVYAGAWHWCLTLDHGELAMHQVGVFFGVRKVRMKAPLVGFGVEVMVVGEYQSSSRTSFEEDAAGLKAVMDRIGRHLNNETLKSPAAWDMTGDINSAGKGMAGLSANEALAIALGIRKDAIKTPDKSPGSVDDGLLKIKTAIDSRPCPLRLASGSQGHLGTPNLWRSIRGHNGKADSTKHFMDALRYGVVPYLSLDAHALARLPSPQSVVAFATPRQRTP